MSANESAKRGAAPMIASPLTLTERLTRKFNDSPSVFGFLGLTVGALTLGLRSLASGDKRQSQLMMRFRVFFQFCACFLARVRTRSTFVRQR